MAYRIGNRNQSGNIARLLQVRENGYGGCAYPTIVDSTLRQDEPFRSPLSPFFASTHQDLFFHNFAAELLVKLLAVY